MSKKGFTLIELLITMAVFIGLSLIGAVSYTYLEQKNEQQTIIDELRTAIQYAKMQAIILGSSVYLEPLDMSYNWTNGLTLTTLNKQSHKKELLYQWEWHHPRWNLSWIGVSSPRQIVFSNNPTQAISNGRFTLVNKGTHKQVALILNRLGRIKEE